MGNNHLNYFKSLVGKRVNINVKNEDVIVNVAIIGVHKEGRDLVYRSGKKFCRTKSIKLRQIQEVVPINPFLLQECPI